MKKLLLTTLMTLSLFSLNANNKIEKTPYLSDNGCRDYAVAAADAEEDAYGEFGCSEEYFDTAMWYYDLCNDSGGADAMLEPVFL
ncbi:hypothetical protein N9438_04140 [Flavobacteriaceae bacterium]|nr:hypothetical protein [Flavobacteriaceae bacterium]